MKTNQNTQTNQITLKDGKSRITSWTLDSGIKLTVGDRVDLPADVARDHSGYGKQATVSRVEFDSQTGIVHIDVDADVDVVGSDRPVVTLNSSFIPESLRASVEAQVRERLALPVIEWEESFDSAPVLRLHQFGEGNQLNLPALQNEIRKGLSELLDLAER